MKVAHPLWMAPAPQARSNFGEAGDPQAWRREMEKAQVANWFHAPVEQVAARAMPEPGPEHSAVRGNVAQRAASLGNTFVSAPQRLAARASSAALPVTAEGLRQDVPIHASSAYAPPPTSPGGSAPGMAACVKARPAAALASSLRPPAAASGVPNAVAMPQSHAARIHLEPGALGVTVWLGLDGDAAEVSARAALLVTELRRELHGAGRRLHAAVCNGTPLVLDVETPAAQHAFPANPQIASPMSTSQEP